MFEMRMYLPSRAPEPTPSIPLQITDQGILGRVLQLRNRKVPHDKAKSGGVPEWESPPHRTDNLI